MMPTMDHTIQSRVRWFHLTSGRVVIGLLAVEGLLRLSERFQWPAWHKGYAVLAAVASVGLTMLLMLLWLVLAIALRRRFQFSIRSLLVLTVAVALPCSWLAVKKGAANQQRLVADEIKRLAALSGTTMSSPAPEPCKSSPGNLRWEACLPGIFTRALQAATSFPMPDRP